MGSWEWQVASGALEVSDELHRIHGLEPHAPGTPAETLITPVHPEDRAKVEGALERARSHGEAYGIEFRVQQPGGAVRRVFEQTDIERDAHDAVRAVRGIRRDITQQTEANERIRTLAYFDPLTGLANRTLFRDMVKQWLPHAQRQGMRCAVLVVDLDRFKLINESFGPRVGDEVLKTMGQRLRECLRSADPKGLVGDSTGEERLARLGGNEFTVLLVDVGDPHQANLVARRIVDALAAPLALDGREFTVSASVGISMTPDDGQDADGLLRNAATAMHAAKQDAQHRVRFYDGAMSAEILRKLTVEGELRRAIDNGDLRVHYQAKVDTRSSRVVGAEALVRWAHPTRGLVAPMEFIPIAEESGLIVPMTQWVVREVCRQVAAWRGEGLATVPVSINLDAKSLHADGLVAGIEDALRAHALEGPAIEFEVTESSLMSDLARVSQTLQQLRRSGIRLAIDDFGTGYSSLTYLKHFPVDILKIDRSFVNGLTRDHSDAALTTAIIAMGQSLELDLIAEGVESWGQADFLAQRGCFDVQGFLFARPLPGAAFADLLRLGLRAPSSLRETASH